MEKDVDKFIRKKQEKQKKELDEIQEEIRRLNMNRHETLEEKKQRIIKEDELEKRHKQILQKIKEWQQGYY